MKMAVKTLAAKAAGEIELNDRVFAQDVREDLLNRVVLWQRSNRRPPARATKGRSEVTMTGKKVYRQKGTGGARHRNKAAPQYRGGGKAHGPHKRDYSMGLNKKIRAQGLRCALSSKQSEGHLIVIDNMEMKSPKTKALKENLAKLGVTSALFVDGDKPCENFTRACANLYKIDVLPAVGANVYDILNHETLVLSKAAVDRLEARLA